MRHHASAIDPPVPGGKSDLAMIRRFFGRTDYEVPILKSVEESLPDIDGRDSSI